jgi:hypothetical protein
MAEISVTEPVQGGDDVVQAANADEAIVILRMR